MTIIAGHEFVDGRCRCGRKWVDIRHVDATYVGEAGYAHTGNLNVMEVQQIAVEVQRERDVFERAIADTGMGSL